VGSLVAHLAAMGSAATCKATGMRARHQISLYFGVLLFANGMGDPTGPLTLLVLFILKDHLRLAAPAVALFEAITHIPYYGAFLFGLLRDTWSPFRCRDRGYLLLAAPLGVGCYVWLAAVPLSYAHLLGAIFAAMIAYQVLDAATQALLTRVAQREAMTGRLSALLEAIETIVSVVAMLFGGWMVSHWSPRSIFLVAAGFTAIMFVLAFPQPRAVFHPEDRDLDSRSREDWRPLAELLRHRALWPSAAILLLFNFSPGWATPLLYYLTDTVQLSSEAFGMFKAVQYGAVLGATVLYGYLSPRVTFGRLLRTAIVVNIFPGFLFLLIGGPGQAFLLAAVAGLIVGFASVALFDLLLRSCPRNLEGSVGMLGHSALGLAGAAADLLGAWLYEQGGFALCIVIDAVATVLILPLLKRLPSSISAGIDGVPVVAPGGIAAATFLGSGEPRSSKDHSEI